MTTQATGSRDLTERIKSAVDLVEVAQGYFPLQKRGREFVALCPFHREKTASFYINPAEQFFHCFGCKKTGDVVTLVMELDKLTFPEALRVLAQRGGVPMPEKPEPGGDRRLRLYKLMQAAADVFVAELRGARGGVARDYLTRRGFRDEVLETFAVGFAPEGWQNLRDALRQRGYRDDEMERAGVVKRKAPGSSPFDLLRNRVVIPIRDARGRVIAFGGRVLDGSEPKYLNTPETELFSKRTVLFGFDRARHAAAKEGAFLVVEGYMDVIAAHQHGVTHCVATLGTSLTREHAHTMLRYAPAVALLFDADEGGRRAADRGAPLVLSEGLDVTVATLPDGMDPDEYLNRDGADALREHVRSAAEDLVPYLIRRAKERHPLGSVSGTAAAVREVLGQLAEVRDPIRRDLTMRRIAQEFGVDERLVRQEAPRMAPRAPAAGASARVAPPVRPVAPRPIRGAELNEIYVLRGAVTDPELADRVAATLSEADFADVARVRVFRVLKERVLAGASAGPSVLLEALKDDGAALAALEAVLGRDIPPGDSAVQALERMVRARDEREYRRIRDEARRSGARPRPEEDETALNLRLAELARFHARRYARTKDSGQGSETGDKL